MSIEVKGLDETQALLNKVHTKTGNLRPILGEIGNVLTNEIMLSFERSASPFGQKWEKLKRPRKSGGTKILVDSGQLSTRWSVAIDANSVSVGTNLIYAAHQNFGSKKTSGRGSGIPARQFLPVDDSGVLKKETAQECADMVAEYITTLD